MSLRMSICAVISLGLTVGAHFVAGQAAQGTNPPADPSPASGPPRVAPPGAASRTPGPSAPAGPALAGTPAPKGPPTMAIPAPRPRDGGVDAPAPGTETAALPDPPVLSPGAGPAGPGGGLPDLPIDGGPPALPTAAMQAGPEGIAPDAGASPPAIGSLSTPIETAPDSVEPSVGLGALPDGPSADPASTASDPFSGASAGSPPTAPPVTADSSSGPLGGPPDSIGAPGEAAPDRGGVSDAMIADADPTATGLAPVPGPSDPAPGQGFAAPGDPTGLGMPSGGLAGGPEMTAPDDLAPPPASGDLPGGALPTFDPTAAGVPPGYNTADIAVEPAPEADPGFASGPTAGVISPDEPPPAPAPASPPSGRPSMALPTPMAAAPEFATAGSPAADPALRASGTPGEAVAAMADSLADRLPEGPRAVGLSLDVSQPAESNINLPMKVVITLRNEGRDDAFDVVVRLPLPDGLEYKLASPLPDEQAPDGGALTWRWSALPASESRVIELTATPRKAVPMDIVPRVSSVMAAKSRTAVQEPKLKIDLVGPQGEVLKGSQFDFTVMVSNQGNGPARNVNLQANLTGGLQGYDQSGTLVDDRSFLLEIGELVPNEVYGPIPLSVLAAGAGEQVCSIKATSPDVDPETPIEEKKVNIVEPSLVLSVAGPDSRPVGSVAEYVVTIANQGTAAATDVIVGFFAPESGTPEVPTDAKYVQDASSRHHKIYWQLPRLDKGETKEFRVPIRLDRIALYPVQVAAHSQGFTSEQDTRRGSKQTDVVGIADVQIVSVTRADPVIDAGGTTRFEIRIRNGGSKEATNVCVDFFTNEWIAVDATDPPDAKFDPASPTHHGFPPIDRLAPGAERPFIVTVKAVKAPTSGRVAANFDVKVFWDGLDESTPVSSNNYVWIAEGQVARAPSNPPR